LKSKAALRLELFAQKRQNDFKTTNKFTVYNIRYSADEQYGTYAATKYGFKISNKS